MAKKKSTAAKRKSLVAVWPGDFTAAHAIVALSLMLNVALLTVLIALAQTNVFDDVIVKRGVEVLCSDKYQASIKNADTKALLKYSCAEKDAESYFLKGYNEYRSSLNLKPVEQ